MSDFSLERIFVVPTGNVLPTTGTTATLTPNQLGFFLPSYVASATGATLAAAPFFFVAQGRNSTDLNMRTLKSDKIALKNVFEHYKITGSATANVQITTINNFQAVKGNQYSITIRSFSNELNTSYYNGLTTVYTVNGPCIECGDDPCAQLDGPAIEALVDEFIAKINADSRLEGFIVASKTGTGLTTALVLTGQAVNYSMPGCDLNANPFEYDAVTFHTFAEVDAPTTMDYANPDLCNVFADVTVTQTASFPRGIAAQVAQIEKDNHPYRVPGFKTLYSNPNFNGLFHQNTEEGVVYDEYVVRAANYENPRNNYASYVDQDFTVRIFVPQGTQSTAIDAILDATTGTLEDKTP